ncbi:MAG: hypothetical protein CL868_08155 [Cytophagaceae bacterium]|nr:hypothetical protein [Cytophagaceae bacterium]|tara:strand:- start:997 stop:1353 length:357 start_codon:yes stop_codon:yes gene_type:complete
MRKFEFADHVVGFIVDSNIDVELVENVKDQVDALLDKHKKISLYFEDNSPNPLDISAAFSDLSYEIDQRKRFNRIALVSDKSIMYFYSKVKSMFMTAEVRSFKHKDRLDALNWVSNDV